MSPFPALGLVVAIYVAYAASTGEVYVKSGLWGRRLQKDDSPLYFWAVIVIYATLSLALITVF
jgi:hypothetical protein